MFITDRQRKIIEIVKHNEPISSNHIASRLNLTRSAIRNDLSVLIKIDVLYAKPKIGYFYNNKFELHHSDKLVKDIMSEKGFARMDISVYDCILQMFSEDIGTIFILSDGYLKGVVSRKDLLKVALNSKNLNEIPIYMIMTRMPNIITISPDDTVKNAAIMLIEKEIDCLPVVERDEDNNLILLGRISKTNITKYFSESWGLNG